jgi:hypothetical protein
MPPRALALSVSLVLLAPLPGCLFGGSSIDPEAFEIVVPDAATSTGGAPIEVGTGGVPSPPIGSGGVAVDSGGSGAGDAGGLAGSGGTTTGGLEAGTGGTPGSGGTPAGDDCAPPPALICDPVKNIGCLVPFTFCDIDRAQAVKTGLCVFPAGATPPPAGTPPPPEGSVASCEVTVLSSTCPPLHTCAAGSCRKLCNCDADCPTGECCTDEAPGPPRAFKLCGACQ